MHYQCHVTKNRVDGSSLTLVHTGFFFDGRFLPISAQGSPAASCPPFVWLIGGHFSVDFLLQQCSILPKKSSTIPMEGGAFP